MIPNRNRELIENDRCAEAIFRADDQLLRCSACYHDWGNALDKVPAIQLQLSDTDKQIISATHEASDWVITIDRNFGIEYFDNPRTAPGVSVRSYLIDYTPEFVEGVGHRLIVSTFWLSEIEGLIHDGLRKMGIPGTGFQAAQVLDVLKSISGKLALKLINNPNDAREIIGLALTRLLLERDGALGSGILIPVDSHVDLFAEHKRQLEDTDIRIHRSDLIVASGKDGRLHLQLVEVKFRSGSGNPAEELFLKEAIVIKNADTQRVLESRFVPRPERDRLDREIQNKQLANLLQFYLERSQRHGLIAPNVTESMGIEDIVQSVTAGDFEVGFDGAGFIYNLSGVTKSPETYKGNLIRVVGTDTIWELLDIPADADAPPSSVTRPRMMMAIAPFRSCISWMNSMCLTWTISPDSLISTPTTRRFCPRRRSLQSSRSSKCHCPTKNRWLRPARRWRRWRKHLSSPR